MLRGDARMRTRRSHTRAPSGLGLVDPERSDVATIDGGHARPPTALPRQGEEPMQNPIPLTGFIQIAVVVNDIERALDAWCELFDAPRPDVRVTDATPNPGETYRGNAAAYGLKLAVIDCKERGSTARSAASSSSCTSPTRIPPPSGSSSTSTATECTTSASRWARPVMP